MTVRARECADGAVADGRGRRRKRNRPTGNRPTGDGPTGMTQVGVGICGGLRPREALTLVARAGLHAGDPAHDRISPRRIDRTPYAACASSGTASGPAAAAPVNTATTGRFISPSRWSGRVAGPTTPVRFSTSGSGMRASGRARTCRHRTPELRRAPAVDMVTGGSARLLFRGAPAGRWAGWLSG